jgi:hypothetical protein
MVRGLFFDSCKWDAVGLGRPSLGLAASQAEWLALTGYGGGNRAAEAGAKASQAS